MGQPHGVPAAFRFNKGHGTTDIGGHHFTQREKSRDVLTELREAFVVDDVATVQPWHARGVEIRRRTEVLSSGGEQVMAGFDPQVFRVTARHVSSRGHQTTLPGSSSDLRTI